MQHDVQYQLTASVDGVEVFSHSYEDSGIMLEELYKAELAVERQIEADDILEKDLEDN